MLRLVKTYDWAFVVPVLDWELTYNFLAWEIVLTHSLIIGLSHAILEPNFDFTKFPLHFFEGSVIERNQRNSIYTINKVQSLGEIHFSDELTTSFVINCLCIDLKLLISLKVNFLKSNLELFWPANLLIFTVYKMSISYHMHKRSISCLLIVK